MNTCSKERMHVIAVSPVAVEAGIVSLFENVAQRRPMRMFRKFSVARQDSVVVAAVVVAEFNSVVEEHIFERSFFRVVSEMSEKYAIHSALRFRAARNLTKFIVAHKFVRKFFVSHNIASQIGL